MTDKVEFGSFYKLLQAAKDGDKQKIKELEWILAQYEHAKDATSAYDELGQIFCHHGVMELYDYTGTDDITYITSLDNSVWNYLNVRMEISLQSYMIKSMLNHAKDHTLVKNISAKWNYDVNDIEDNIEGLAKYVTEGIVEIIIKD